MVSPIAAIGALERPHPITPELPPVPRPNPADAKPNSAADTAASTPVNTVRPVVAMQEIVQAKTAQAIQVQNTIQTAHTLMQATAAVSPRAQQEAAAKAAAAERKAQATAAALSLSTLEHALSHGLKTNAINSTASTSTLQTTDSMQQDAALQAQSDLAQQQAQQQEQLLASIGNGSTFGKALGSVTSVSPVAVENMGAIGSTPSLPAFSTAPAPPLHGSHSGKGSSSYSAPLVTGTTSTAASSALFDSRGNLQGQRLPDLSLLGQQQAKSVQQARALSQSLALSVSGQLQPSLILQLGLGAKLFELLMQSHRRMGSLSILQEARSSPELQAIDGDEALQAIQSTNQILVAVYLEHMFSLIAAVRRQMAQKRGKKQGQTGEETGDSSDSEGEELNELSAELDYIKQARKHTSNQDFHASMLIPRH